MTPDDPRPESPDHRAADVSTASRPQRELPAGPAPPPAPAPSPERRLCAPPIDIFETEDGLVLRADLPGVKSDGLELQVQDNKLTLFGRVQPEVPPDAKLLHQEYHVCDFLRSFILSDEVDHERISAKITSGVLEVVLPKAARPEPRRIHVRTE
ncbi:MAG: Hsp20/alpha crystallin family protein [Planctomycetaceae bacterium]